MDSSASGLARTKSEQLETKPAAKDSLSRTASAEAITMLEINSSGGVDLAGKPSSGKKLVGTSPGRKGVCRHIRKSTSAQLKFDLEDVTSGAALSRASSASLGFSFTFTGFTAPPEDISGDIWRLE
ncbi:ABC transporter G family member 22 [Platanthera guangdongensis]|uniref:ABC transporter G family member 22 n=1 Tax=Platanthera guangdongensis TaxID=2320717 RepID=A0ABR2LIR6_9ASPA